MKTLCTHNGSFHTDDVMGYVILRLFFGEIHKLIRTRNQNLIDKADVVWDVGNGRYDHHFKDNKPYRYNGVPYSSAGLIWKDYGKDFLKKMIAPICYPYIDQIWCEIDKNIMVPIDLNDNGKAEFNDLKQLSVIRMITDYNLSWEETMEGSEDETTRFVEAANALEMFFINRVKKIESKFKAKSMVIDAAEKILPCGIIELPCQMPWNEVISENNLLANFVIVPSNDQWRIYCVAEPNSLNPKFPLPEELAGLSPEQLKNSSISGVNFVHSARFTAGTETKETAIKLCEMAYENVVKGNRENNLHAG